MGGGRRSRGQPAQARKGSGPALALRHPASTGPAATLPKRMVSTTPLRGRGGDPRVVSYTCSCKSGNEERKGKKRQQERINLQTKKCKPKEKGE